MTEERYEITLRPEPGSNWRAPGLQRLRLALKTLLRSYGLRCINIKTETGTKTGDEAARPESREAL